MNNHLVVGYCGEIGTTIYKFLVLSKENVYGIDIKNNVSNPINKVYIMHVCIPYNDNFVETILNYKKTYKPKIIIVYSTVAPGTCRKLGKNVVHSPIEGRHPDLLKSFYNFKRLISGNKKYTKIVSNFFVSKGLEVEVFNKCEITELGKLLSTTRYGVNLMFADISNELCNKYDIEFVDAVFKYQIMYNQGYANLGERRFNQQLLIPPNNKIGGHCIIPNAKILSKISDSKLIKELENYGTGK